MTFAARLVAAWYAPRLTAAGRAAVAAVAGVPRSPLRCAARSIGAASCARSALPVPVVVVGNITVGGSGKTPLVVALAEALARARPASRHREPRLRRQRRERRARSRRERRPGDRRRRAAAPRRDRLPGVDRPRPRRRGARALLDAHPACDVVMSDDGLQHYALARDVEIAVVDGARGLGNGLLLPAGPLREPASRLDEVDAVVRLVSDRGVARRRRRRARDARCTHDAAAVAQPRATATRVADPARMARAAPSTRSPASAIPQRFFALLRAAGHRRDRRTRFPIITRIRAADLALPGATRDPDDRRRTR